MKLGVFILSLLLLSSCGFLKGEKDNSTPAEGTSGNGSNGEESLVALVADELELSGPASAIAGSCVSLTLKIKDQFKADFPVPSNFQVGVGISPYTGAEGPEFFKDSSCSERTQSVTVPEGASDTAVYLKYSKAGSFTAVAFFTGASQAGSWAFQILAAPASRIRFRTQAGKTGPVGFRKSECVGLAVALEDSFGNPVSPSAKTRIDLGGAGTGAYYENSGCTQSNSVAYIEANAENEVFFYKNSSLGEVQLVATKTGLQSGELNARIIDSGFSDPSFAVRGFASTDFGANQDDRAQAVAVQSDGKIIVAGFTSRDGNFDFAIARYLADGSLDSGFGSGGIVVKDMGTNLDLAYAVAVDSDGSIYVGGSTLAASSDFSILKLKSDGSLDSTFGQAGTLNVDFGGGEDAIRSLKVSSDGNSFIAGGSSRLDGESRIALYKGLTTTGAPEPGFNGDGNADGKIVNRITDEDVLNALAIKDDGKIVVAGSAKIGIYNRFLIQVYLASGALDTAFNGDGTALLHLFDNHSVLYAVAVDGSGNLILGGASRIGTREQFTLFRMKANGEFDEAFNSGFPLLASFESKGSASLKALAVQADGKIIAVGYASKANNLNDMALARINPDGLLDDSFGNNGLMTLDTGSNNEEAKAVVVSGSSIIAVGHSNRKGSLADFLVSSFLK